MLGNQSQIPSPPSKKQKTMTEGCKTRSISPRQIKFKSQIEKLFGDLASQIQIKSLEAILQEYKDNLFYRTKIKLILAQFQRSLQENGLSYEEFKNIYLSDETSQKGSFKKRSPVCHHQILKNKVSRSNYAYAVRLLEIKQLIKKGGL